MKTLAFNALALMLFLSAFISCSKDPHSSGEELAKTNSAQMNDRKAVVYLAPDASEVLYSGSFQDSPDFLAISTASTSWGTDILDENNQFEIPLALSKPTGKALAIDTILVKVLMSDSTVSWDTVIVIRSAPIVKPLYGDSLPVVDKNGKYQLDFTLSHPSGLVIEKYWINDLPLARPCTMDSAQSRISCLLRLEGTADTIELHVQDEVGILRSTRVVVFKSNAVAQLVMSLPPQLRLGVKSQELKFDTKVITNGSYSRFELIHGEQKWLFDSSGVGHVQLELPPLRDPTTVHQVDTLPFYLRFVNGKNVDTISHIIHRMRPEFSLKFMDSNYHDNTLTLRYPDTSTVYQGIFSDTLAAPIAKIQINGLEPFNTPFAKVFRGYLSFADSSSKLTIYVADTLGNSTTVQTQITITGRTADYDQDGILNYEEMLLGFLVDKRDSDSDGVPDTQEDRDGDNLSDFFELHWTSDYTLKDTDNDGLSDSAEYYNPEGPTNPRNPDTDGDGSSDYTEVQEGFNPLDSTQGGDADRDGLSDPKELNDSKTNPFNIDTDQDGVEDGYEYIHGMNPNSADSDSDHVFDKYEVDHQMNPLSNDTDGDGILDDGDEFPCIANGRLTKLKDELLQGKNVCTNSCHVYELWYTFYKVAFEESSVYAANQIMADLQSELEPNQAADMANLLKNEMHTISWKVSNDSNSLIIRGQNSNFAWIETVIGPSGIVTALRPNNADGDFGLGLTSQLAGLLTQSTLFVSPRNTLVSDIPSANAVILNSGIPEVPPGVSIITRLNITNLQVNKLIHRDALWALVDVGNKSVTGIVNMDISLPGDVGIDFSVQDVTFQDTDPFQVKVRGKTTFPLPNSTTVTVDAFAEWQGSEMSLVGVYDKTIALMVDWPNIELSNLTIQYKKSDLGATMGIASDIKIGSVTGSATYLKGADPKKNIIMAEFSRIKLSDMLGVKNMDKWNEPVIRNALLYINPEAITIGDKDYPEGFYCQGDIDVMGIQGSIDLYKSGDEIKGDVRTDPINIGNDFLRMTSSTDPNDGPQMTLILSPYEESSIKFLGKATTKLFYATEAELIAGINTATLKTKTTVLNFSTEVSMTTGIADFLTGGQGFQTTITFGNEFNSQIQNSIISSLNSLTSKARDALTKESCEWSLSGIWSCVTTPFSAIIDKFGESVATVASYIVKGYGNLFTITKATITLNAEQLENFYNSSSTLGLQTKVLGNDWSTTVSISPVSSITSIIKDLLPNVKSHLGI